MAAKLLNCNCTFPTILKDSIITIMIGDTNVIEIPVPWIKGEFELDKTYYDNDKVFVYMCNEEYKLVIRFDGSATVYTLDDKVRLTRTVELPKELSEFFSVPRSVVHTSGSPRPYSSIVHIHEKWGIVIIDSLAFGEPYILKIKDNPKYYQDLWNANSYYPPLGYDPSSESLFKLEDKKRIYDVVGSFVHSDGAVAII